MDNRQIDYSTRDYEGFRTDLITMLRTKIPEYTDFSQSDVGIVLIELLSHGLDILSYYSDVIANEVFLSTAQERESVMRLTGMLGYTMGNATASRLYQVFEITPQVGDYLIPRGTKVTTGGYSAEQIVMFETATDLIIPSGMTGAEDVAGEYTYKVAVVQGETITDELLGSSDGTPDQQFKLWYKPLIVDSIALYIDEGFGSVQWNKVDSFLYSDVDRKDFIVLVNEQDEAYVMFGNGVSGKIPGKFVNGITASYRIGGGIQGNVAPNTITEMVQKPAVVVSTFNPSTPFEIAIDKESIESAKVKAVIGLQTLNRAVTLQDFTDLAKTLDFVSLSKATFAIAPSELVSIYVLPKEENTLSVEQVATLEAFFEERAMLGMTFEILSPVYVDVDVTVSVKIKPDYTNAVVKTAVEQSITSYFALGLREFGEEVALSSIVMAVNEIDGVRSVTVTLPTDDVVLGENEIPVLHTLTVTVTGGV